MIIGSHCPLRHLNNDLNINVDNQQLMRASTYKYLRIEVDKTLRWQCQADAICKKVPRQTLLRMYEALVLPYLDYCSEIWGCMQKSQCDRLQRLQIEPGEL